LNGLSLAIVLQAALLGATDNSYTAAHKETVATGRPMIILVGADWCPACVNMKNQVIPQVQRRGFLRKVAFAVVNLDRQSRLGRKLTGGGPIPQFIMFRRTKDGWRRRKLIGGQSVKTVCNFIEEGVRLDEETKKAAAKAQAKAKPKKEQSKQQAQVEKGKVAKGKVAKSKLAKGEAAKKTKAKSVSTCSKKVVPAKKKTGDKPKAKPVKKAAKPAKSNKTA
jgi:thioredoxin-like negative regulator of GroEL